MTMISREKIEKRILEEYENFVFQGYSTEEIAYMGTCLQRWAIEKRMGPANIEPLSQTKPNPDYWLRPLIIPVTTNTLIAMAVHGALCLALRHPSFKGRSRKMVVEFTKSLGRWLVQAGALTSEQLRITERKEAREGSPDLGSRV